MLNPSSLFLACFIALAANPSLVATIPLPPSPHSSSTSLHRRSFRSARNLPVLRIVDDEQYLESAPSTSEFTDDSILPESIFTNEEAELDAILDSVHQPHSKRAVSSHVKRSSSSRKASHKKVKRAVARNEPQWVIKASSRAIRYRATATNRPASTSIPAPEATTTLIWSKVPTMSSSIPSPTSTLVAIPSAEPIIVPTTTVSSAPTATPSLSGSYTGEGTWYAPGLGACGNDATDDSPIVAVSHLLYDSFNPAHNTNPNNNPICGRKIRATYKGKTVDVTVQDRCTACAREDLDFSPSIFAELADLGVGRLKGVEWTFL